MSWRQCTLDDVVEFHSNQRIPLSSLERESRQGPYRYYGAQGVIDHIDNYIFDGEYILVAEDGANLVTLSEPIAQLVTGQFWVNNHAHVIREKPGISVNYFIYTMINHLDLRGYITGAAQPKLNQKNLRAVKVKIPDIENQKRIENILSNYDNLLATNVRRIEILEQSVQHFFKEWFVRLRYPGHEHDKIVDGVPEGWERQSAFDAIDILSGGTPKTSVPDYWNGEIPFYTPKDAARFAWVLSTARSITERGLNNCNSRLYPKGTVFISARGTVGKLNLAQRPMAMSQSCYALVGRGNVSQLFVYCAMESTLTALQQQAGGAVFNAIIVDTFKRIPVLIPNRKIAQAFEELAAPIFAQIELLQCQNDKLTRAYDLLLPRLMDGRIAV